MNHQQRSDNVNTNNTTTNNRFEPLQNLPLKKGEQEGGGTEVGIP